MRVVRAYVRSLFDPEFVSTSTKTALFVGSLLFLINHGAAFARGEMNRERWTSVVLTYVMPYLVSVYGQYSYRCQLSAKALLLQQASLGQNVDPVNSTRS